MTTLLEFTEQLQSVSSTLGDGVPIGLNKGRVFQYTAPADEYVYLEFSCEQPIDGIVVEIGATEIANHTSAVLCPVSSGETLTITVTYGNVTGYQLLIAYNMYYIKYPTTHYVTLNNDYVYPTSTTVKNSTFIGSIFAKSVHVGYALPDIVLISSNMLSGVTLPAGPLLNTELYDYFNSITAHYRNYVLDATQLLSLLQHGLDNDTYFECHGLAYTYHVDTINTIYLQRNGKNTETIVKNEIPASNNYYNVLAITNTAWLGAVSTTPNSYQVLDGVLTYMSTVNGDVLDTKWEVRKTVTSGSDTQVTFTSPKSVIRPPTPAPSTRLRASGTSPIFD